MNTHFFALLFSTFKFVQNYLFLSEQEVSKLTPRNSQLEEI